MWMRMNENIKSWRYLNRKLKGAEKLNFQETKKKFLSSLYHKKYKIIGQITTNIHSTNFINIFFNFLRTTWYFSISISYKIYFLRKWDSEKTKTDKKYVKTTFNVPSWIFEINHKWISKNIFLSTSRVVKVVKKSSWHRVNLL